MIKSKSHIDSETKNEVIKAAFAQIEKAFGKGSIMRLGERPSRNVRRCSSGSLGVDIALGGGYPEGRIIEIYGPESSGKTTLTIHAMAEVQKKGGDCACIDVEHAFDPEYAKKLGVNIDKLIFAQPSSGEQALSMAETLVRAGVSLIVIDSVAALVPKAEIEGEMGDSHMGLQARLMSQALRKLTSVVSQSNSILIFINQIRMKIGVMFGNPETTTGGNALKFYSSVRLDIRKTGTIKEKEEIIGSTTKVKVVKNKVSPPFKTAEFDIIYGQGIVASREVFHHAVEQNIIQQSGAWFSYNEQKIAQGKENAIQYLQNNPSILEEIKEKLYNILEIASKQGSDSSDDEEINRQEVV